MAPLLSAPWGPGVALGLGQLALVATVTALSSLLLVSLLLMLCASCQGQKKKSAPPGDHENLMNGVSEKEAFSQSVDSPATDMAASSSQNGPLTCVLSEDTLDTSPHLSEEMLSSQSELRSSKCHQDRELPSIPPNSALEEPAADLQAPAGDGTYEVVKEAASRDVSVEDSLYETVKEPKDPQALANGHSGSSLDQEAPPVLNGRLSPEPPDRAPLPAGVEYASVDLNKKSRYSADLEGRRAAEAPPPPEPEDEQPPPIPDKVLDENDNQQTPLLPGEGLENGEIHSPLSPAPGQENDQLSAVELADMYSSVVKPAAQEKEHDYSSIGEINGLLAGSTSSDLYATVKDVYTQPDDSAARPEEGAAELLDPAYETIGILKAGEEDSGSGQEAPAYREPDYESVEFTREISRL